MVGQHTVDNSVTGTVKLNDFIFMNDIEQRNIITITVSGVFATLWYWEEQ